MALISCRATINLVGAKAGEHVLVDPEEPQVALHMEKGYLVAVGHPIAESGDGASGEGDSDEGLEAAAVVGHDAEAPLEPVSDGVDETLLAST